MGHAARMGLLVNLTWGDSWRKPKEGLGHVVDSITVASQNVAKPTSPDDPSVDIYIYVSGAVWQHAKSDFKLGTLSGRSRNWQRVSIYVPDHLTGEAESVSYFNDTLENVALAVDARLRRTRPEWPVEELVRQIRSLKPSL